MKNEISNEKERQAEEPIVIADECGDSMWDAVLGQEVRACQIINAINNPETLINTIKTEQPVESDNAK
jgi:fructose-specific phosphotransferase system component IIB